MIHKFNLRPFRGIIDSNLYGFAKYCVTYYADSEPNSLYLENVETNLKNLKDFIKYIKQDKSIYTFKHLLNTNHLYSLVWFIIINDETVKRNESFLRFASSVCVSMILESEEVGYAEGKEQAKALRDKISSYLQELDGQEELDELN